MKHNHKNIKFQYDVKKHIPSKSDRPMFVFVYMIGCPYCDMMMPEWQRMERIDFVDTMMINHQILDLMKEKDHAFSHMQPNGYPHIELMPNASVNHGIPYNGERSTIHFIEFVENQSKPDASTKKLKREPSKKKIPSKKKPESPKKKTRTKRSTQK